MAAFKPCVDSWIGPCCTKPEDCVYDGMDPNEDEIPCIDPRQCGDVCRGACFNRVTEREG